MVKPEFGFPQGYAPPEGVTIIVPTPVGIPVENLVAQDHSIASARLVSQYDEEDPRYAFFIPTQATHPVMPIAKQFPNPTVERLYTLEEKFRVMEVHNTPEL